MQKEGRDKRSMKKEISELLKKMDIHDVETQMAFRCAPFLTGLKTSNLLIVDREQKPEVRCLLDGTGADWFLLYEGEAKAVLLLYEKKRLGAYLKGKEVRRLLRQQGYTQHSCEGLLESFAGRYRAFMLGNGPFPHEIGIFLGYPPEDVAGFMKNKGSNCLYAGDWKVYGHAPEKICLFQKFDRAKEVLLRLLADGVPMAEILRYGRIKIADTIS